MSREKSPDLVVNPIPYTPSTDEPWCLRRLVHEAHFANRSDTDDITIERQLDQTVIDEHRKADGSLWLRLGCARLACNVTCTVGGTSEEFHVDDIRLSADCIDPNA